MDRKACRFGWKGILCVALVLGCSKAPHNQPADEETAVRAQFAGLQVALKNGDADKLWMLLDSKSRADAERAAQAVQATHAKANPAEKAVQEKTVGLTGPELAGLTGKGFLKSKRFQGKYHDLPESTIEKVVIQGASATVHYLESDGDKEKAIFVRQDGQWKAWLPMPRATSPNE